jgi:oxygen-independent coproporphyrinogen III oxidase
MAGIYIHIPFCRKLCNYCDFYHLITSGGNIDFINTVIKEMTLRQGYLENETISTIYVGGGTPSVLQLSDHEKILESISRLFNLEEKCEITIELNPEDVNNDYLTGLKNLNINRVSLGIQSWRDQDLKMLNRRHNAMRAYAALEETFKAGFENVSIDLIYGFPGMKINDWATNLDIAFSYPIKHLSAYHMTVEPGTVFGKMKGKGQFDEIEEEESIIQFQILVEKSKGAGLVHYEISNFGKPGYFSIHNTNYWRQVNYLGLGPSAHSFNGYSRQWNVRNLRKYIKFINEGKPLFEREELDLRARFNEYIMTSLRTMWGIDLDYVENVFEKEGYDYVLNLAGKYKNYGLIKQVNKNLILTDQGKMISDNIISELMMAGDD